MKSPYIKIRIKYGRALFREETISIDKQENSEWWSTFVDELKLAFMDDDMTSISIRRIKK